jgi:hypothetical protein
MSFAIGWEADPIQAGGFIYLDAVLTWNRSFTGQVTKHPVDGGSSITDSYINNNPIFTMSAVISATDISIASIALANENGDTPSNIRGAPTEVLVKSDDQSLLMRFVPSVVGQFLPDTLPEVIMDGAAGEQDVGVEAGITEGLVEEQPPENNTRGIDSDYTENIQDILSNLQSSEGYNQITGQFETIIRPVTLYETNGFLTLVRKLPANNSFLVITSINFREDAESGYAVYADITFEQVRFANLKKVQLPPDLVQTPVKKKAASKKSLGKCDSTQKDTTTSTDTSKSGAVDEIQSDIDPLRTTG